MSVRKRKWITRLGEAKETWVVNYTDQQGVRRLKTFDRKKDADPYHASVKVDVKAGIHTTSKTTVAQAGEKWIADAEGRLVQRFQSSNHMEPASIAAFIGRS